MYLPITRILSNDWRAVFQVPTSICGSASPVLRDRSLLAWRALGWEQPFICHWPMSKWCLEEEYFPFPCHNFLHPKLARRGVGTIMEEEEEAVVKAEHVACCRRQWVSLGAQLHYCQVFGNIVDTFRLHRA